MNVKNDTLQYIVSKCFYTVHVWNWDVIHFGKGKVRKCLQNQTYVIISLILHLFLTARPARDQWNTSVGQPPTISYPPQHPLHPESTPTPTVQRSRLLSVKRPDAASKPEPTSDQKNYQQLTVHETRSPTQEKSSTYTYPRISKGRDARGTAERDARSTTDDLYTEIVPPMTSKFAKPQTPLRELDELGYTHLDDIPCELAAEERPAQNRSDNVTVYRIKIPKPSSRKGSGYN